MSRIPEMSEIAGELSRNWAIVSLRLKQVTKNEISSDKCCTDQEETMKNIHNLQEKWNTVLKELREAKLI